MNLLFSIDDTYVDQWKVTLFSIVHNSNVQAFSVYVLQIEALARNDEIFDFCKRLGVTYYPVIIGKDEFQDAPTSKRYPETIYYRLLAHEYLPQDLNPQYDSLLHIKNHPVSFHKSWKYRLGIKYQRQYIKSYLNLVVNTRELTNDNKWFLDIFYLQVHFEIHFRQ